MPNAVAQGRALGLTGAALLSYAIGQLDARVTLTTTNPIPERN